MSFRGLAATVGGLSCLVFLGLAIAQERSETTEAQPKAQAPAEKTKPAAPTGKTVKGGSTKGNSAKSATIKGKAEADAAADANLEKATFGGGCFWCLEAVFERIPGVKSVVSGYAGGSVPRPSYEMVCTGMTGHAEVVQITYDPKVVSFDKLLTTFWEYHDPTTLNRQGPDEGTQYRSIILYHSEDQKAAAQKSYEELTQANAFPAPIVTQLVPLTKFYAAEKYHQDYYRRHRNDDYCQMYIVPKLLKMQSKAKGAGQR